MQFQLKSIFAPLLVIFILFFALAISQMPSPQIAEQPDPEQPDPEQPDPEQPDPPKPKPRFIPIFQEGGKDLESSARNQAINALRGQGPVTEGTIVHEATHFMQHTNLSTPMQGFCPFYLWGQNRYLIMPTANFRKILVLDLVPRDTVTEYNINTYFGSYFTNRDAIHIIEDFVAELNGFETNSPSLLRDMLVFSVALGLKMEQTNHEQLKQYQAGNKFLIEQSTKKPIDLTAFKSSPKASSLRNYLKRTYGEKWYTEINLNHRSI